MLNRCSANYWSIHRHYEGCEVCSEWNSLSNFISWVDDQPNKNWEECELDKDLLVSGNKLYSPTTCVFVTKLVNNFLHDRSNDRGEYLLGVYWDKVKKKYTAQCSDPFRERQRYLGRYDTQVEAHEVWKKTKHEYACRLADLQEDVRVANILRNKFIN